MNEQELSRQMAELNTQMTKGLSDKEKARMRKWMMDSQPKAKAPKKAYHATSIHNMESILKDGIKAHEVYGEIYLCDEFEQCLRFIPKPCVVFEIDTKQLLPKRWRLSLDHNRHVFNFDVYCYFGDIDKSNIVNYKLIQE